LFWGHFESEEGIFTCGNKVLLILNIIEIETGHIAARILEDGNFYAIGLLLSHFLLELQHFSLRLITNSHQFVFYVLASRDVLHPQKRIVGALQFGPECQRHKNLLFCTNWNFFFAVDAER
jgi:hypothetical protein